jgi:phosphoglycolate phosphatase
MNQSDLAALYAARSAERSERLQRFLQLRLAAVQGVIFDLDGTMVDTAPDFELAVNAMRADYGLAPLPLHQVTDCIGKGSEHLVRATLAPGMDPLRLDGELTNALRAYQRHYQAINGKLARPFPEVFRGLARLQDAGLALACVTNKPYALAMGLLEKTGLAPYFSLVYGGDSLPFKKPDPLPIREVCRVWALMPDQVLMVGDSSNDVAAARAAGCLALTVPYGYNHGQPIAEAGADRMVDNLAQVASLLAA